jgi:hypothetical protein
VLRHIGGDIRYLYAVSALLSRPGFERIYLHSTGNREFDPRVQYYADFDLSHIQEKLHEWTSQWKNQRKRINKDEPVALGTLSGEHIVEPEFWPSGEEILVKRLAKANTKRREQLLYWSGHPDVPPDAPPDAPRVSDQIEKPEIPRNESAEPASSSTQIVTLDEHSVEGENLAPPPSMTLRTFSKVPASDAYETQKKDGHTRTEYKKSIFGRNSSNRVPDLPVIGQKESFECPFCHIELKSVRMRKRDEWK